ncbi:MAG: cell division protein FtsI [Lachnospiraceae bacterium]|nr:cell division protein FtsI [Lachnospiraceae bacterium]
MEEVRRGKTKTGVASWMRRKLAMVFLLVLAAFVVLGVRLYLIVRDNSETYKRQVLSQQQYDSRALPARRGRIVDANGTVFALSERVYNIILDTKALLEKDSYLGPTMAALVSKFGIDEETVLTYINTHPGSRYYVLKRTVPFEQITAFRDLMDEESENYNENIHGVWFEEGYRRSYPNGALAGNVIGFTTSDGNGLYGVEEYYNDVLSGTPGREYGYLGDDANPQYTVIPASAGNTVVLTIDSNIQAMVERNLREFAEAHENTARMADGAHNIGCIIQNVNTGEILAMAGYPAFNPADTQNREPLLGRPMVDEQGNYVRDDASEYTYLTNELLDGMEYDHLMQQYNALWRNFCISDTYEPGSVVKPFTVAAALENGTITGNEWYQCNGQLHVGDYDIACHNKAGHGAVSVSRGIEVSCNVAMMHIGASMGIPEFAKFQNVFNFGLKTGVDLAGEARTQDLVFGADQMGETELATYSFGQGFNVTMIETISAFSSLVNGGYYYEPHVVKRIVSDSGATVKNIEPRVLKQTVSATTSDIIRNYCNQVVSGQEGSGKSARPAGYRIGGKTGTAETLPRTQKKWFVVSFMGYAPADNPQIAIYVVVDRPNAAEQDSSRYATTIVKGILTEVLPYLGIPMTEALTPEEQEELHRMRERTYLLYDLPEEEGEEGTEENGEETPEETPQEPGMTTAQAENTEAQQTP